MNDTPALLLLPVNPKVAVRIDLFHRGLQDSGLEVADVGVFALKVEAFS
nr:hypothetical protein [Halochromatium salexigens]